MRLRLFIGLFTLASLMGCAVSKAPDPVPVAKGMNQDQVQTAMGVPDRKMTDPVSGLEMWSFHSKQHGQVLITFSNDAVAGINQMRY